eukprot:TRINITY_DN10231_c0_g1_i1.p1 TRINITY_DN10231_c0_g1~~TRINITY_DN10231_c0_g1_i1.p1  ORF type:complete len:330 (+),score=79.74 TRINITY_DN10231_c0_g1_i1:81-1070(+)
MNFNIAKSSSSKYGLQLRAPKKPAATASARPPPSIFNQDDAEDDVEGEIARQASVKGSRKDVEQQHQKALEEDPSIFDYDGVYDTMKTKVTRPLQEDRAKREPKYIGKLVQKAKLRQMEHEIIYERQLAKERSKEDHLYADKEKFVTSAYKRKLAERDQWLQEEKLRERLEEKEDVTKKSDLSDFYSNLLKKNVAFGAKASVDEDAYLPHKYKQAENKNSEASEHVSDHQVGSLSESTVNEVNKGDEKTSESQGKPEKNDIMQTLSSPSLASTSSTSHKVANPELGVSELKPKTMDVPDKTRAPETRRNEEALAAARERYIARKKARQE